MKKSKDSSIKIKSKKKKNPKKTWSIQKKIVLLLSMILVVLLSFIFLDKISPSSSTGRVPTLGKPNIYLYPEEKKEVLVTLDLKGKIFADYPKYDEEIGGWEVIASPDGTLINTADNKEYSYLFWEGKDYEIDWNIDKGFVVPGDETREFLQDILPSMGLTPKEYNEFIVYWYPLMQDNPYNLIHFSGKQYTNLALLNTIPAYDSLLRVFMVAKPLQEPVDIEPQVFPDFKREGFTVVEWGGTIIESK